MWGAFAVVVLVVIALVLWAGGTAPAASAPLGASNEAQTVPPISSATGVSNTTAGATSSDMQALQTNNKHMVTITTNKGVIVFETFDGDAPNTVANFIKLAKKGYYDNVIFHRVIKDFMIQGGDPTGTGTGGPGYTFADELNPATASYKAGYVRGTVAMANAGPNTNGSQFFIMHKDVPLPHAYSIFGKVVSGMDVVDAIATTPTDRSDRPLSPITMQSVVVTDVK